MIQTFIKIYKRFLCFILGHNYTKYRTNGLFIFWGRICDKCNLERVDGTSYPHKNSNWNGRFKYLKKRKG